MTETFYENGEFAFVTSEKSLKLCARKFMEK